MNVQHGLAFSSSWPLRLCRCWNVRARLAQDRLLSVDGGYWLHNLVACLSSDSEINEAVVD